MLTNGFAKNSSSEGGTPMEFTIRFSATVCELEKWFSKVRITNCIIVDEVKGMSGNV
jgi:hypothetical protein